VTSLWAETAAQIERQALADWLSLDLAARYLMQSYPLFAPP
jgi:hypothetical protein